jgi:hypothetical protein
VVDIIKTYIEIAIYKDLIFERIWGYFNYPLSYIERSPSKNGHI